MVGFASGPEKCFESGLFFYQYTHAPAGFPVNSEFSIKNHLGDILHI